MLIYFIYFCEVIWKIKPIISLFSGIIFMIIIAFLLDALAKSTNNREAAQNLKNLKIKKIIYIFLISVVFLLIFPDKEMLRIIVENQLMECYIYDNIDEEKILLIQNWLNK